MNEPISLRSLRWVARILSILNVGIVMMFLFGEGLLLSSFTGRDFLLFLFFPLGMCIGIVLAWWWEGIGGGIAVGSLVAFYLVHYLTSQCFPRGAAFMLLALPGILFFVCWLWKRLRTQMQGV